MPVYMNSLLASLNARGILHDQMSTSDLVSLPLTPLQATNSSIPSHYPQAKVR